VNLAREFLHQHERIARDTAAIARIAQEQCQRDILARPQYAESGRLQRFGYQVFSQNDEDGMIAEAFRRIGVTDRVFAECGVDNGLETNTTYLLAQGWRGYWFEGNAVKAEQIRRTFRREIASGQLTFTHAMLTRENIAGLFERAGVPPTVDLLSIDVDQNTSHLWRALSAFHPRLAVIEYNPAFPPGIAWEVRYEPNAVWDGSLWFGASLKTLESIGAAHSMALVGCNIVGVNAFFVADEFTSHFAAPFTAEHHYEPPRLELLRTAGNPRGWR